MIAFLVMDTLMVGVFCALDAILFYLFFEGDPDPDVPDHRHLGRAAPDLRRLQVLPLHAARLGAVPGRDPGDVPADRHDRDPRDLDRLATNPIDLPVQKLAVARDVRLVRGQGADVAVPHLAARRACRGADRGLGAAGGRAPEARRLRLPALLAADAARRLGLLRAVHLRAVGRRDHLHLAGRADADRHEEADRLLVGGAHGHRDDRRVHAQRARHRGRRSSRCSATASSRPPSSWWSASSTTGSTAARSTPMAASPSACRSTPPCSCCS